MGKIIFACLVLFSCTLQEASVIIHNKSNSIIDSVYFPHEKKSIVINLRPNQVTEITTDITNVKSANEGLISIYMYKKGKPFFGMFGYAEDGFNFGFENNHIYLFDNGYQNLEKNLSEPDEFTIFLINKGWRKIDSINSDYQTRKNIQFGDSTFKIYLNYKGFKNNPVLNIYQQGENYSIPIKHDWENWNYTEEVCYLQDSGKIIYQSDIFLFR